jgi:ribosome assembly protein YihI (activator of Der GTPase)
VSTIDVGSELEVLRDQDGLDALRDQLVRQAGLFETPDDYAAGVDDTLDAIRQLLDEHDG